MRVNLNFRGGRGDSGLAVSGGNITGELLLFRDPVLPLEASTRQYVLTLSSNINASGFTSGTLSPARLPALTGDLISMAGSGEFILSNSGVVAGTHAKVVVNAKGIVTSTGGSILNADIPVGVNWNRVITGRPTTLSGYGITDAMPVTGGTMTGVLALNAVPVNNNHSANRQYVDTLMSTVGTIAVGDIIRRPSETTPAGFLRCNGGIVSIAAFPALHAVIGQQFSSLQTPGSGQPWRQQYEFNTEVTPSDLTWTTATSLPGTVSHSQAIVTRNRVFLLGGIINGAVSSIVYTAPINADGTLGAWTTATSLPGLVYISQAIVTRNRVFLLGGSGNTVGSSSSIVYTASINTDGTLGTWTTATSLPGTVRDSQAIVTRNRVFILGGGINGASSSIVYTAPINADGTLGIWTTAASLPSAVSRSHAIVTRNRVFLLGGGINDNFSSIVYTAPINADGTIGGWTTATSLPGIAHSSQVIVTKNRVFILGGRIDINSFSSIVYTAPINADGTLGTWTTATSLPGTVYVSQAIVTRNRVFLLGGGINGVHSSIVYTAPFTGGLNDYSPFYDGSIVPLDTSTQFQLPDINDTTYPGAFSYIKT